MRKLLCGFVVVTLCLTPIARLATADDAKDEAINKDRKHIEGTWRIVPLEINGNKAQEEDARTFTVVNGSDAVMALDEEQFLAA